MQLYYLLSFQMRQTYPLQKILIARRVSSDNARYVEYGIKRGRLVIKVRLFVVRTKARPEKEQASELRNRVINFKIPLLGYFQRGFIHLPSRYKSPSVFD